MRSLVALACLALAGQHALAQDGGPTDLWRIATVTLTTPPALQRGPTATFWNPAAPAPGVVAGLELVQASDAVGVAGALAGIAAALGRSAQFGLVAGRMNVQDLVRTTTSPSSEPGGIPVYAQFVGAVARVTPGRLSVGAQLSVHDSRFDSERASATTLDVGARVALTNRLALAAATHFLPIDLDADESTDYYAGVEYLVGTLPTVGGVEARLVAGYGLTVQERGGVEHAVATGFRFDRHVGVDVSVTRESGFGDHHWRPGLGISLNVGRYLLSIARANGVNDLGATYRMSLNVGVSR